ncbi:hypothetical protein HDU76_010717, partial [Blyttiomyces sp. JEL0837]
SRSNKLKLLILPFHFIKKTPVLTSDYTFSAAEQFAVCVQSIHRAKTVGKTTAGGGYPCRFFKIHNNLRLSVSIGITKCCATGKGWQGIGAPADIECEPKNALDVAHLMACKDIANALESIPEKEMTMIKGKLLKETKKVVEDLESRLKPADVSIDVGSDDKAKEGSEGQLPPGTHYKVLSDGQYEKIVVRKYTLFGVRVAPTLVFATRISKEVYESEMAKKAAAEGKNSAKEE